MQLASFQKWIRTIYATQDDELDCDGFFEVIPQYVDLEVAGEKTNPRFPKVEQHLRQCPHCHDLYLALSDAVLSENHRNAP
jgi:predicted anti-sigma-YlaC factor YlaD